MNIPVLALSHHPKVATLMDDLGLSEYCLDMHTLDLEVLMSTFVRLADNRDRVKACMAEKAAVYRSRLTSQFDTLFPEELSLVATGPPGDCRPARVPKLVFDQVERCRNDGQ
jgi:polysaccharide pyruvyl transferase WcaK-like protein